MAALAFWAAEKIAPKFERFFPFVALGMAVRILILRVKKTTSGVGWLLCQKLFLHLAWFGVADGGAAVIFGYLATHFSAMDDECMLWRRKITIFASLNFHISGVGQRPPTKFVTWVQLQATFSRQSKTWLSKWVCRKRPQTYARET